MLVLIEKCLHAWNLEVHQASNEALFGNITLGFLFTLVVFLNSGTTVIEDTFSH